MEEKLKDKTETELLRLVNKSNEEHIRVKNQMLCLLDEIKILSDKYNLEKEKLFSIESYYVKLMEEVNNRKNVI